MKKQTKIISLISFIVVVFIFGELANQLISIKWLYFTIVVGFCGVGFWIFWRFKRNADRFFICENCSMFPAKYKIIRPIDYFKMIEQVKEKINQGKLILIEGTCSLAEISIGKPFPDDIIVHKFRCTSCASKYELWVDTYHGNGYWNVKKGDNLGNN